MSEYLNKFIQEETSKQQEAGPSPIKTIDGKPVGSTVQTIDPDTIRVDGESFRIRGYNAPEIAKQQGGIFVPNQIIDDTSQVDVNTVARIGGYTNLERDGKDPYGRTLAKQTNAIGESLGDTLTALGLAPVNLHSTDAAVQRNASINAISRVLPELAQSDPLVKLSRERLEERIKGANGNPLYIPKTNVIDEQMYAALKKSVGIPAVKSEMEEIARLKNILATEQLSPDTKSNLQKKLKESQERLFFAATTPDMAGGVMVRSGDRNMMNEAHSQFTTSLDRAMLDVYKGLGGALQSIGDTTGWEWLSKQGQDTVIKNKVEQNRLADTLSSFREIRANDPWSTIKDTATYVSNLMAGTLPTLAITVGSTVATGGMNIPALAAAGLSTIPASIVYSGSYYADQPDDKKNAELAWAAGITSAVLDRAGLEGMMPKGNLFTTVGREALVKELINTGKATSQAEALKILENATKKELVDLSKAGAAFAKQQINSKEAALRGLASLEVASGGEALTETAQQYLEMLATSGTWNTDIKYERNFYENLLDAAIGGKVMGMSFGVASGVKNAAEWQSLANANEAFRQEKSAEQQFNTEQVIAAKNGSPDAYASTLEAARGISAIPTNTPGVKLEDLNSSDGAWNGFKSIITDPGRLIRQLVDTTVPSITNADGTFKTNLAYLKAIMGKTGILPGEGYSGFKQRLMGDWSGQTAEELASNLKTDVRSANRLVQSAWQNYWSKGKSLPADTNQNIELQQWKNNLDTTLNKMRDMTNYSGSYIDELQNIQTLFESSLVHPKTLMKNKERIIDTMVNNGSRRDQAETAINNIVSGDVVKAQAARDWMSQHGVFSEPSLNNVFETNIFNSLEELKDKVASRISHDTFLGKDGSIIAKLLQRAKDNGEFESEQQYLDTVKNVKDWYKIINGKYNPLTSYPKLEKILGWGVTLTMLASLGKAAISSQVEVATSTLGTKGDLVTKQISNYAKDFLEEIRSDINAGMSYTLSSLGLDYARNIPNANIRKRVEQLDAELEALQNNPKATPKEYEKLAVKVNNLHKRLLGRSLFERLGYNEAGYNTQAKFELPNSNMRRAMQVFASIIGLRATTDATRMAALSTAGDTVLAKLQSLRLLSREELLEAMRTNEGLSNEQGQSLKLLQEYGMDVLGVIDVMNQLDNLNVDPSTMFNQENLVDNNFPVGTPLRFLQDNLLTTIGHMIDSKVVNPQPHNLPKYYHDPRLRLLTAMTRFMAGMHSTVLPTLYKKYMIEGDVGMRYQAFTVVGMALAFAMLANMLKDELSYGEESPYIKGSVAKAQRTLYTSGLLGQYERVIDALMPLYPDRKPAPTEKPFKWAYENIKDISPVVSWADKPVQAMYNLSQGKTPEAAAQAIRATPVLGSFPIVANEAKKLLKE